MKNRATSSRPSISTEKRLPVNKSLTLLWGATGEQEWTPALTTGLQTIFYVI